MVCAKCVLLRKNDVNTVLPVSIVYRDTDVVYHVSYSMAYIAMHCCTEVSFWSEAFKVSFWCYC